MLFTAVGWWWCAANPCNQLLHLWALSSTTLCRGGPSLLRWEQESGLLQYRSGSEELPFLFSEPLQVVLLHCVQTPLACAALRIGLVCRALHHKPEIVGQSVISFTSPLCYWGLLVLSCCKSSFEKFWTRECFDKKFVTHSQLPLLHGPFTVWTMMTWYFAASTATEQSNYISRWWLLCAMPVVFFQSLSLPLIVEEVEVELQTVCSTEREWTLDSDLATITNCWNSLSLCSTNERRKNEKPCTLALEGQRDWRTKCTFLPLISAVVVHWLFISKCHKCLTDNLFRSDCLLHTSVPSSR